MVLYHACKHCCERRIVVLIHCYMRNRMYSPNIKIEYYFNLLYAIITLGAYIFCHLTPLSIFTLGFPATETLTYSHSESRTLSPINETVTVAVRRVGSYFLDDLHDILVVQEVLLPHLLRLVLH
jgi:hypothetical protein